MTNTLLISSDKQASSRLKELAPAPSFTVSKRHNASEVAQALALGVFDLCVVWTNGLSETDAHTVSSLRSLHADCPIIVLHNPAPEAAQINAAYAAGADILLETTCEPAVFQTVTRRLTRAASTPNGPAQIPLPLESENHSRPTSSLEIMRDFSRILTFSLDDRRFIQHFLQKLREIVGVNRIAVFIEPAPSAAGVIDPLARSSRLLCSGSVGIPQEIAECFELSRTSGIGQRLSTTGQILRLRSESPLLLQNEDPRILREFEILKGQVAIPITDRERCIGVAILGGKLTGERLSAEELELLFHLMEELGLAIKNSWLHTEVASSHQLLSNVLATLQNGCLVVSRDLEILHINRACQEFLCDSNHPNEPLHFASLPAAIAAPIHDMAERGQTIAPFTADLPNQPGKLFRVSIIPFQHGNEPSLPQPVVAVIEDFTKIESAKRAEIESSNLKLTALIARRFAHEIRNSLVPLTTHQQLFDSEYSSEEFRLSLKNALTIETGRIQRFTEQMLFLSHTQNPPSEIGRIEQLLREAFANAQAIQTNSAKSTLEITTETEASLVKFHRPSLLHALKEIFLNSLQSAGPSAKINVHIRHVDHATENLLEIAFRDSGPGFTPQIAARALEPFFTTRNTGVGLGLTVARKVMEDHRGGLAINVRGENHLSPDVALRFPQDF